MSPRGLLGGEAPAGAVALLRRTLAVWLGLLALALVSLGLAYLPVAGWNRMVGLGIAAVKMLLIAWFFMQLRRPAQLPRLAAVAALLFIPTPTDQNPCAQLRRPMDMMRQG